MARWTSPLAEDSGLALFARERFGQFLFALFQDGAGLPEDRAAVRCGHVGPRVLCGRGGLDCRFRVGLATVVIRADNFRVVGGLVTSTVSPDSAATHPR